jgi:hypothetical protein
VHIATASLLSMYSLVSMILLEHFKSAVDRIESVCAGSRVTIRIARSRVSQHSTGTLCPTALAVRISCGRGRQACWCVACFRCGLSCPWSCSGSFALQDCRRGVEVSSSGKNRICLAAPKAGRAKTQSLLRYDHRDLSTPRCCWRLPC